MKVSPLTYGVRDPVRAVRGVARGHPVVFGRWLLILIVAIWAASFLVGFIPALAALTLLGFVLAVVGLARPRLGLLGIGILSALDALSRVYLFTGGLLRWNSLGYWLLLVTPLFLRDLRRSKGVPLALVGMFLLLLSAEISISPAPASGVQHVLGIAVVFGLLGYSVRGGSRAKDWILLALVTGVLAASGGLALFLERRSLAYINPNAASYLPLTALCLTAVAVAVSGPRAEKRLTLRLLAIINSAWIFLSGSRGSFLVALIVLAFVVAGGRAPSRIRFVGASLVLLSAVGIALFTDPEGGMTNRMTRLFDESRSLANRTSGRSDLAMAGWAIFLDHPFGIGTGGFSPVAAEYGSREALAVYRSHPELQAHSAWIKTLAENGVPGMILLVAFVTSFTIVGWRRRRGGGRAFGVLVSLVLGVAFLSTEFQAKGIWLFAAAAMTVLSRSGRPLTVEGAHAPRIVKA